MKNGRVICIAVIGSSAINGSLNLSRALAGQGFEVIYLAFGNEHKAYLESQGFHVHAIDDSKRSGSGVVKYRLFIEWINLQIEQWLDAVKVELALLDSHSLRHSIPFLRKKIRIINVNCTLSSLEPNGNPPVFSGLLPPRGKNLFFSVYNKAAWGILYLSQVYRELRGSINHVLGSGPRDLPSVRRQVEMLGGKTVRTEYGPRLVAPEILLGSRCLDFPNLNGNKARHYAGPCVDVNRQQQDLDLGFIDDKRALIYCAMGTSSKAYPGARNLCQSLFQAMEELPDHQLVIQTESITEEDYPNLAENIRVFDRVPQLQLLQSAQLFITHGGHGSIREGAFYGVPMIVFPGWHDQPGNAARVVYHGVGLRSSMKSITPRALASMIRSILHNPQILSSVKQMQTKITADKEIESTVQFITNYIT